MFTTLDPMRPVPPITTIFIILFFVSDASSFMMKGSSPRYGCLSNCQWLRLRFQNLHLPVAAFPTLIALNIAFCYGNGFPFLSLLFAVLQFSLDSRIRNQPEERNEHIQCGGDPWTYKSEWD